MKFYSIVIITHKFGFVKIRKEIIMKKILLAVLSALLLTSCGGVVYKTETPVVVYSSFYAMDSFVKTIGGENIVHHSIVPLGSEPHDFEPSAKDMAKLSDADLFVYSGGGIDDWVKDVASELPENVSVVCASEQVETDGNDPHVWLSTSNAKKQLQTICDALSVVDEDNFESYRQRLAEYTEQIDELEAEYRNSGFEGKKLFVTHGAYGYLCAEFGMEQVALEGISGESDPSPSQMAQMVEEIKASGAKCIFYDPLEKSKLADAVASEAGIQTAPLYTFEGDAEHRDYVETMALNLEQLKKGL